MLGERIKKARLLKSLSQKKLAAELGISVKNLSRIESGKATPNSEILLKICEVTGFRVAFFFRKSTVEIENIRFKTSDKLTKRDYDVIIGKVVDTAERQFEIFELFPEFNFSKFNFPDNIPSKITSFSEISRIAKELRETWGFGGGSLIRFLESRGLLVFTFEEITPFFEGMTAKVNGRPLIVVGIGGPLGKQSKCIAHELGHIILDGRLPKNIDEKSACDEFSKIFLEDIDVSKRPEMSLFMERIVIRAYDDDLIGYSRAGELLGLSVWDFFELNRVFDREENNKANRH